MKHLSDAAWKHKQRLPPPTPHSLPASLLCVCVCVSQPQPAAHIDKELDGQGSDVTWLLWS